jgi:hypothetical protein
MAFALISPLARAQTSPKVAAEALFREGRRLVDAGQFREACEKFSASQRLDAAVGTLLNLGLCYERIGRTATAWATYHEAIATARSTGQAEREKIAKERAAALEPALARLAIVVSPEAVAAQPQITRDGVTVAPELWGMTTPVDPGEHVIEARAAGKKPWSLTTSSTERATTTAAVPALEDDVSLAMPAPSPSPDETAHLSSDADTAHVWSGQKTGSIVLVAVGAIAGTVATVEGLRVLSKKNDAESLCPGWACAEPQNSQTNALLSDATQARTLAFVAGGVGVASVIGAAWLWLGDERSVQGKSGIRIGPTVSRGAVGLGVDGAW